MDCPTVHQTVAATFLAMNNASPEVLYFGCLGGVGHFMHSRRRPGQVRWDATPFGNKLDGGLITDDYYGVDSTPTGEIHEHHKDGWTAVSFWDRSGGDRRPGCNSTFLVNAEMSGDELLALAKEQWPGIFRRPDFPITFPDRTAGLVQPNAPNQTESEPSSVAVPATADSSPSYG